MTRTLVAVGFAILVAGCMAAPQQRQVAQEPATVTVTTTASQVPLDKRPVENDSFGFHLTNLTRHKPAEGDYMDHEQFKSDTEFWNNFTTETSVRVDFDLVAKNGSRVGHMEFELQQGHTPMRAFGIWGDTGMDPVVARLSYKGNPVANQTLPENIPWQ